MNRAAVVHRLGVHHLFRPWYGGIGAIFVMHRIVVAKRECPAADQTITARFLEEAINAMRAAGTTFVSMDDVIEHVCRGQEASRIAALTFDDGYRSVLDLALPILRRLGVPATLYIPTGAPDATLDVWWLRLEEGLHRRSSLTLDLGDMVQHFVLETPNDRANAYRRIVDWIHADIETRKHLPEQVLSRSSVSDEALCRAYFLDWDDLGRLAADPLVTIGSHTVRHRALSSLGEDEAAAEMTESRRRLAAELDVEVDHFAYPFGSQAACGMREFALARRAGYATAVTTRRGNVFTEHAAHPTALPRYALGGSRESASDPIVSLSGAPIAVGPRWRDPIVTV